MANIRSVDSRFLSDGTSLWAATRGDARSVTYALAQGYFSGSSWVKVTMPPSLNGRASLYIKKEDLTDGYRDVGNEISLDNLHTLLVSEPTVALSEPRTGKRDNRFCFSKTSGRMWVSESSATLRHTFVNDSLINRILFIVKTWIFWQHWIEVDGELSGRGRLFVRRRDFTDPFIDLKNKASLDDVYNGLTMPEKYVSELRSLGASDEAIAAMRGYFSSEKLQGDDAVDIELPEGEKKCFYMKEGLFIIGKQIGFGAEKRISSCEKWMRRDGRVSDDFVLSVNLFNPEGAIAEDNLAGEFSSPHIVEKSEFRLWAKIQGQPFLGLITKGHSGDALALKARLSKQHKVQVALDTAKGLRELHRAGYIHRDIKPANILVDFDKEPQKTRALVADLGAAVQKDAPQDHGGTLSYTPCGVGSHEGERPWIQEDDLYSLGVTLNELFHPKECWTKDDKPITDWGVIEDSTLVAIHSTVMALMHPKPQSRLSLDRLIENLEILVQFV